MADYLQCLFHERLNIAISPWLFNFKYMVRSLSPDVSKLEFVSGQLDSRCVRAVFVSEHIRAVFMSGREFVSGRVWAVFDSECVRAVFASGRV